MFLRGALLEYLLLGFYALAVYRLMLLGEPPSAPRYNDAWIQRFLSFLFATLHAMAVPLLAMLPYLVYVIALMYLLAQPETTLETRVPSLLPRSVTFKKVVVSPSSPSSFAIDFACTPAEEVATTTVKIACFLDTEFSFSMGTCAMEGSRPTIVGTFGCNA